MTPQILASCTLAVLLLPSWLPAQSYNVPTPSPVVSAADRDWFIDGRPIYFAGDLYYPAGPRYHFDPDVMVETGMFDGIPLYADTSAEPYGQVLVPIGGGLVQPYERRRAGPLAGTTGSHAPEYPVEILPWESPGRQRPASARGRYAAQPAREMEPQRRYAPDEDEQERQRLLQPPGRIQTILAPEGNRGIWIMYEGTRWSIAGNAVPFDSARFAQIGKYRGFPVFASRGSEEIYIPAVQGMLAVYKKDVK